VCLMKNKYHIVLANTKTKEQKIVGYESLTFAETASKAYVEAKKLLEKTGTTWEIVSIYNLNYNFDIAVQLT